MNRHLNSSQVPDQAMSVSFVRSSGPGGQNVNKVSSAVQLRVDLTRTNIPAPVQQRLTKLAGNRATSRGEIVIQADRFRSQARNREDAVQRFFDLLDQARQRPKRRIATRLSTAAKLRRKRTKQHRGATKKLRSDPSAE